MQKDLEATCTALDALAAAVVAGWSSDQTFCEQWGWNFPVVNRHDLAGMAQRLAAEIRAADLDELDSDVLVRIKDYPRRLQLMQGQLITYLYNGNAAAAVPAYLATLQALRAALTPSIGWQTVKDTKTMPAALAKRLRYLQAAIDQIAPDQEKLRTQISEIQEAHTVAESLPVDLAALSESRERVSRLATESELSAQKAKNSTDSSTTELNRITGLAEAAEKLVAQCEEAFRITTTKGLAAAFDQRAKTLGLSMWAWVVGLMLALAAGTYLGAGRVAVLTGAISGPDIRWGVVGMHVLLSLLSIGAPIWFAWLATKQIGQRFRLAEDYAFKASVAKSYEGYRREAARLDDDFSARLFGSALTRLEEAPLRLVETTTHGSPWHEFFSAEPFQRAISTIPELKDSFFAFMKKAPAKPGVAQPAATPATEKT